MTTEEWPVVTAGFPTYTSQPGGAIYDDTVNALVEKDLRTDDVDSRTEDRRYPDLTSALVVLSRAHEHGERPENRVDSPVRRDEHRTTD